MISACCRKFHRITDRITEQGSEIVINRTREGQDVEIHIPLDGSQKDNDIMGNDHENRRRIGTATF